MRIAMLLAAAVPQTQAELNARASDAFIRADQALNVAYRAAMARARARDALPSDRVFVYRTGPSYANDLLQAERAWLAHRHAQCAAEGEAYEGGSIEPMIETQCETRLTRERAAELKAMGAR